MAAVKFLYQYPDLHGAEGNMLDAGRVTEVARVAEQTGWSGYAFTEHPAPGARWIEAGGHQTIDPFVALGNAAAVTETIRLVTYLTVVPYRNPFLLAKAAATVDQLSGGRMTLGVGTGYLKSEFHALGVDFDERNTLFDEALDAMALHWSGEPFRFAGTGYEAREVVARPAPVQQPIPIWIGGNSRRTTRRVAERAQGWMPMLADEVVTTTTRTAHIDGLEDLAERITDLRAEAGDRAEALDVVVPYHALDQADPSSDVGRHRDAFAAFAEAGVTWVAVPGRTDTEATTLDFLTRFGEAYVT